MGDKENSTAKVDCECDITLNFRKAKNDFPFAARESCVATVQENKLYVFGGVIQSDHAEPQETNELLCFDIDLEAWQRVKVSGSLPPARAAASLVAVGKKLFLFGGLSHMTGWFDDVCAFDTATGSWSELKTKGIKPRARDKLQGVAIGTNIYYFGGFGPKTDGFEELDDEDADEDIPEAAEQEGAQFGWFNDLYVLNTVDRQWTQPLQMNLGVPTPRAAHGMCAISNNIFIFGGRDVEDRQNDLHCFDVVTRKWDLNLSPQGLPPEPRSFHTVTAVGSRVVVIGGRGRHNSHYGDIHIFDTETRQWLQPSLKGAALSPRGQHISEVVGGMLVVFGGTGSYSEDTMQCQHFYTDTLLLNTEELAKSGARAETNGSGDA